MYTPMLLWLFDESETLKELIRAVMAETSGNLRKRILDEADGVDAIEPKIVHIDETESVSCSASSSSSSCTLLPSTDEETARDTTSSDDILIPYGPMRDSVHFNSPLDAWRCQCVIIIIIMIQKLMTRA